MCGIAGYFSLEKLNYNYNNLKTSMSNRGPDSFNNIKGKLENNIFYDLFFSRLSIIDLNNRSNQPFIKFNKIFLFNGEIYNYLELKNELKKKYSFSTKSDTEVLLTAYQEYGENFCERLEGMWSFVIVDKEKNSFLLSNDRFGEKPLYYYKDKKSFIFASELSYFKNFYSIDFSPNLNKLESFLYEGYRILKQDDKTFIKNIFSFPQSNIWKISNKLKIKKKKYWDLKYTPNYDISDLDIKKKTSALLQRSY